MRSLARLYQPYLSSLALLMALLAARMAWHGSLHFAFLFWNLFLALLPLLFSHLARKAGNRYMRVVCVALWIVFFPNAAYLFTDIVHLRPDTGASYWLDLVLLFGCGLFGVAVGLRSLGIIEGWMRVTLAPRRARLIAYAVLIASGYGIYLGRIERWNSWDLLCNTGGLLSSVAYELRHPLRCMDAWLLSGVFAAALLLSYTAFGRRLR